MQDSGHRSELLEAAVRFIGLAPKVPGVRSISLLGSIVTDRSDPKDIDFLLVVSDSADLSVLATYARRLQGRAQQVNRGADVFLADEQGWLSRANLPLEGVSAKASGHRAMRSIAVDGRTCTTI